MDSTSLLAGADGGAQVDMVEPAPLLETPESHRSLTMSALEGRSNSSLHVALGFTFAFFALGIAFYTNAHTKMTVLDALYFCVTTLTSVGYGDVIMPHQDSSILLFTSFYVFFGVGIVGAALGIVLGWALDKDEKNKGLAEEMAVDFEQGEVGKGCFGWLTASHAEVASGRHGHKNQQALLRTFLEVSFTVMVGTLAYQAIEKVSLVKAFYWCCVTVTTVGYGDVTPSTDAGKWFAIVYMLLGTFVMAKALASIAAIPLEIRRLHMEAQVLSQYGKHLSKPELAEIASDPAFSQLGLVRQVPGGCTKTEFIVSMLVKLNKLDAKDVQRCADVFAQLDENGDNQLTEADLAAAARCV